MHRIFCALSIVLFATVGESIAQEDDVLSATDKLYEEILVTGGADAIRTLPGSATLLDEDAIAAFDITDINELLAQVPGVYIRQEDGYGLRPNIGIRGATSERSQKITLMEDGMLIAPAPYSAPAAYYFPNINRMSAVEVFKGPASIQYGPHTIGGAVNLVTPPVPDIRTGLLNISYGSDSYYKGRVFYGDQSGNWGYSVDALSYGAEGFKELDGGGDTGFVRNDVNTKLQWQSSADAAIAQTLQIKIGYADEDSDETYLGLTDADFQRDPQRRYSASALDRFTSEHSQLHLLHTADFGNWRYIGKAYVNRFDRSWNKFDGLFPTQSQYEQEGYASRVSAAMIFEHAQSDPQRLALIRGDIDSDGSLEQTLDITDNARQYGSHGLEAIAIQEFATGNWQHKTTYGLRYHHDYVERDHRVRGYLMNSRQLVWDGNEYLNKALNTAQTDAVAAYVSHDVSVDQWLFTAGVRGEWIDGTLTDDLAENESRNSEEVLIPGVGVFYQWNESLGLLLGINKGFSPNGPGAADATDPEESVNYEYGFRYRGNNQLQFDAVGFFSDYQNLLGRCRVSDPQCDAGEEFNGGNVEVAGLELNASYEFSLGGGWFIPASLIYTYTESAFQDSFESDFSQWGTVEKGDELPYLPEHQAQLLVGLIYHDWMFNMGLKHVGEMRERPGRGQSETGYFTEAYNTVDVSARYQWDSQWTLQLIAENVGDQQVIVARKPFGARPNSPRLVKLALTYEF